MKMTVRMALSISLFSLVAVTATVRSATPEISSVTQATTPINVAFTYTITATNSPTSFNATNLAGTGLSINTTTGVLSGTPATPGQFSIPISATNASGTGSDTLVLTVYDPAVGGAPVITSDTAFSMVVNTAAANVYQIAATNTPTSFGATGLPAGLSVSPTTGIISAAAVTAAAGQYPIVVTATNSAGVGNLPVVVVINPSAGAPVISNVNYNGSDPIPNITVSSGTPVSYNATGVPAGITLNTSNGTFSGSSGGNSTGKVWSVATYFATDAAGRTGVKTVVLQIFPIADVPGITSGTPPIGMVGQPYSFQLSANASGTSFNAVGLLSGLTMNSFSGLISGTPTAAGQFTVTFSTTLAGGRSGSSFTGTSAVKIQINPAPPTITSTTSVSGTVGTALTYQILATPTPSSFAATSLPPGLSVNAAGLITGTPTTAGAFMTTVSASKAGLTGNATVTFSISPTSGPVFSSALTATATKGAAFTYKIVATGQGAIMYSTSELPPGLTLAGDTISGTPTVGGLANIALTASIFGGATTQILRLTILSGPDNLAPTFSSLPVATPNPATTGVAVTLSAAATDPNSDVIGYNWDFGDGLSGVGASVTHVYTAAGVYAAKVTISDGTLTDFRSVDVGVNDATAPAPGTFTITKASIHFNLKKALQDTVTLGGVIGVPSGFTPATKPVSVGIGDLRKDFVLSSKGKGGDASNSFTLTGKPTSLKYSLTFKRQTLLTALQSLGFSNATTPKTGTSITFPVVISIDGVSHLASVTVKYKATANKTGSAALVR